MKLNEITKTGYYTFDLDGRETVYEVIENTDKEWLKEDPEATLLIDEWTLDHVDADGRKCYEIYGGNLVAVKYAEDIEVDEITDTKYIMPHEEMTIYDRCNGTAMREDKSTRLEIAEQTIEQLKQKLEKIKNVLIDLKTKSNNEIINKPADGYYTPSEMHYGRCEARIEIAQAILQIIGGE